MKITKEEIKSLDRVVEFVQLTPEKCLSAIQLNITTFYDPFRFENGIVKNWLDVWYVDRLKEKYATNGSPSTASASPTSPNSSSSGDSAILESGGSSPNSLLNSPSSHLTSMTNSSWSISPNDPLLTNQNGLNGKNCFMHHSSCDSSSSAENSSNENSNDYELMASFDIHYILELYFNELIGFFFVPII